MRRLLLVMLFVGALGGCTNNVGPAGLAIGGPCFDLFDCVTGSFCLQGSRFPSGHCTTNCGGGDCRSGSQCIDVEGGVCLISCTTDDDCREGYGCRERLLRSGAGMTSVCIGG